MKITLEQMALLITADGEVSVIPRNEIVKSIGGNLSIFSCTKMKGSNNKQYKYTIFCDDDGLMKRLPRNFTATCIAHPLMIMRNQLVGPAVIEPSAENRKYTMDDWEAIRDGMIVKDDESNTELVEFNSK